MILLADSEGPDQTVRLCPKKRFARPAAQMVSMEFTIIIFKDMNAQNHTRIFQQTFESNILRYKENNRNVQQSYIFH